MRFSGDWFYVVLIGGASLLLLVALICNTPKAPSPQERLTEVREEIGIDGILEYIRGYATDGEISEYLYEH